MKVVISALLSKWQAKVYTKFKRFNIIRAGRRTGKTFLATYSMMRYAIEHPGSLCWFIALDISTCNELAIPEFERICPPELIIAKNKQTRTYTLWNGSKVCWKTAESADSLRGRGVDFVVLEEAAFWKNGGYLWESVVSPQLLGRKQAMALFISSPNGNNWFRRLESEALEDIKTNPTSPWSVTTGTIYDNDRLTEEEIAYEKSRKTELAWKQEYLAEYVDEIGQVYWQFKPLTCVSEMPLNKSLIIRGLDWGIGDNTACVWIDLQPDNKLYIFDEHVANNLDVPSHARIIHSKSSHLNIHHSAMDASAWKRESDMSSVAQRFAKAGINLTQATREYSGALSDAMALFSEDRIIIHPSCRNILDAMQDWQHNTHEPDVLAAMRYGIHEFIKMGRLFPNKKANKVRTFRDVIMEHRDNAKLATPQSNRDPYQGLKISFRDKITRNRPSWPI